MAQDLSQIKKISEAINGAKGADRVDLFNELAWEYRKSHPDSMLYYTDKAIEHVKALKLKGKLAQSFNYKGIAYHYKGDPIKSFDYYHKAIDEALAFQDSVQYAHSLNSLGRLFFAQGDLIKAYDYYFDALELFKKVNNKEGLSYCYKSLSELYQTQNNYEKALEMSERALKIRQESGNIPGQISLLIELGEIQEHNKHYNKSFDYYLKAKVKAEALNDVINIANTNIGIAHLYCVQKKYSDALHYAQKALKMSGGTGNMTLVSKIHAQLGRTYFLEGKFEKANYYFDKVLKASKLLKNLKLQQEAYYNLAKICEVQGRIDCAYKNFQQHSSVKDSLNNAEVARKIERMESLLEIEKRELENEMLLENQAEIKELNVKQQLKYNLALSAAIIAIFILIIKLWTTGKKRRIILQRKKTIAEQQEEIKAKNEMIFYQNQELQNHNRSLAELNSEKDILMSIVAHDLKSPFNSIKGIAELLNLSELNEDQRKYISLLKKVSEDGLNLIKDLLEINAFEEQSSEPTLSDIHIHDFLLGKQEAFQEDAELKQINLKVASSASELFLHSDAVYLSRILHNLISNAIKFSNYGKSVILKAGENEGRIFISVKDYGQGFSEADKQNIYKKFTRLSAQPTAGENSNGLGLAIVKLMVDRLGAEIELHTELGKGSEFIITFPLRAAVEAPVNE